MRVLNYLELEDRLDRSGIGTATVQQRRALDPIDGVEVVTDPWGDRGLPRTVIDALRGRRALPPVDLVHCNAIGPGSVAVARLARRQGIPIVLHAHVTAEDFAESFRGSTLASGPLKRYLRRFYSSADLVLCPSEHTRSVLSDYPVSAPTRSISNGVDREALRGFESVRGPYRERYGIDGPVIFAVGNVFERKGLTTFCRLAEETEHEFAWFGPYDTGPLASRTVRRWTKRPPSNVTFTGWVDDVRGAFAAGDIYCLPTKAENQGIAVLEAMACGKPVVLRDLPVFREYYDDGVDCLLCDSFEAFREAIDRLAGDPDLRERLGANARETAREHGLDRVGRELTATYRAVLENPISVG